MSEHLFTCLCPACQQNRGMNQYPGAMHGMAAMQNVYSNPEYQARQFRNLSNVVTSAQRRERVRNMPRARQVAGGKLWQLTWRKEHNDTRTVTAMSLELCWGSYLAWERL